MAYFCATCDRLLAQGDDYRNHRPTVCKWCGSEKIKERARGPHGKVKRRLLKDAVCAQCGTTESLTIDHIVPLSKGGTHRIENLQVLCYPCNQAKGAE